MSGQAFRKCFEVLELGMGVGGRPLSFESVFSKRPHQRSKVIQRYTECLTDALGVSFSSKKGRSLIMKVGKK